MAHKKRGFYVSHTGAGFDSRVGWRLCGLSHRRILDSPAAGVSCDFDHLPFSPRKSVHGLALAQGSLVIMQKAEDIELREFLPALEKVELYGEGQAGDVAPQLLHQLYGRLHRAPRRQQVVHQDNILARLDGVEMNFERVRPILQIVGNAGRRSRQLSRLSYGDKSSVQAVGERRAEDEAARFDAKHQVDVLSDVMGSQRVNQFGKALLVLQQCRDVVKENARLGKVGDGADQFLQRVAINRGMLRQSREQGFETPSA